MNGYGLWLFVLVNIAVVLLFAVSSFHPRTNRDRGAFGTFIIGGFWAISAARGSLYRAQKEDRLALDGLYARMRHPQYVGFMAIMVGFLLQWPTIPTLVMFPVPVYVYRRLAISEERETRERFGARWDAYAAATPRFIPRRRSASRPRDRTRPSPS